MMKMEIKLDEARMIRENCSPEKAWAVIDALMKKTKGNLSKEILSDGGVMYSSVPEYTNTLCYFGIAYTELSEKEWFAKYVTKWLLYDNNSDESQPFSIEDIIAEEKIDNPLFQR